jgi:hypothetical protein
MRREGYAPDRHCACQGNRHQRRDGCGPSGDLVRTPSTRRRQTGPPSSKDGSQTRSPDAPCGIARESRARSGARHIQTSDKRTALAARRSRWREAAVRLYAPQLRTLESIETRAGGEKSRRQSDARVSSVESSRRRSRALVLRSDISCLNGMFVLWREGGRAIKFGSRARPALANSLSRW